MGCAGNPVLRRPRPDGAIVKPASCPRPGSRELRGAARPGGLGAWGRSIPPPPPPGPVRGPWLRAGPHPPGHPTLQAVGAGATAPSSRSCRGVPSVGVLCRFVGSAPVCARFRGLGPGLRAALPSSPCGAPSLLLWPCTRERGRAVLGFLQDVVQGAGIDLARPSPALGLQGWTDFAEPHRRQKKKNLLPTP